MLHVILKGIAYIKRNLGNKINTIAYKSAFAEAGQRVYVYAGFYCTNPKQLFVGNDVLIDRFCSFSSEFSDSYFKIGNNVKINSRNFIDYSGGLEIGDNSTISAHTKVFTHSHGYDPRSKPVKKPLKIGRNVWIGSGVTISENVEYIGDNSIVAAGAVVTKNVESGQIVGGNPAKFIKNI